MNEAAPFRAQGQVWIRLALYQVAERKWFSSSSELSLKVADCPVIPPSADPIYRDENRDKGSKPKQNTRTDSARSVRLAVMGEQLAARRG